MGLELSQKLDSQDIDKISKLDAETIESIYQLICKIEYANGQWKNSLKQMQPETLQRLKTSTIIMKTNLITLAEKML